MAHCYLRISIENYDTLPCPQAAIDEWVLPPIVDNETETPRTSANTTIRDAIEVANLGSAPAFEVEHADGAAPDRNSETPTHIIIPLNNLGGNIIAAMVPMAQAEGVPFSHVYLSHRQMLKYLNEGILPES